ncbi:uncharacterized protein I303_104740 [Kwoniella dejecticola CBS 10117]|uniref:Zinc-finger domain-containing protein n=1 Tax=Kwoniella dejecticola CBS 10117 TaxID=1296121 RepID=A0A1A6A4G5_9TREE|nr:uncharacterized protein I303_04280 [Kwoniella dejecticola CBS 10117]OBR84955.1 hypothetical protein I303_04280 [Kwoniella dejecticola CBS 10117]
MTASPSKPSNSIIPLRSGSSTSDLSTLSSDDKGQSQVNGGQGKGKKRARESDVSTNNQAVKKPRQSNGEIKKERGVYCHICRRICDPEHYLRCTKSKGPKDRQCHLSYCDRDLTARYGITADQLSGIRGGSTQREQGEQSYGWECPCCKDDCQASGCRKKKGLEPIGNLSKKARASELGKQNGANSTHLATPSASASPSKVRSPVSSKHNAKAGSSDDAAPPKKRGRASKADTAEAVDMKATKDDRMSTESSELSDITPEQSVHGSKKGKPPVSASKLTSTPNSKKQARPSKVNGESAKASAAATPKTKKLKAESLKTPTSAKSTKTTTTPTAKAKKTPIVEIGKKSKNKAAQQEGKATPKKPGKAGDKDKEKKVKPKPVKKPEVIPEPPVFEKVDTKLGREEAEQRIMLREYLFRFRAVLSFPERALPALDDFDRPLTEASVRLFAGAMLDMVKEELQYSEDEELTGTLFNVREELRYYADLARFQAIYNMLAEPLDLRSPPLVIDHRAEANNSALRAILDLDENQPPPAWAAEYTAGPSRRTGASRIPPATEVIRMLLAFADRTLSTPKIRGDTESFVPENDMRRKHASAIKKETLTMEAKKKKLNEARLKCKTAADTKANKEETAKEIREHSMRIAMIDVNLEAQLARRALRYEPLGVDLDGRVYYLLAPRVIEDEGRPPLGWASGLMVWGQGVEGKPESSGLPASVERWSHFGKASNVALLIKWIEWRYKKHLETMKSSKPKAKTPKKAPVTPSKATSASGKKTPKNTMKQQTLLEVVIPTSAKKSAFPNALSTPISTQAQALGDDASSASSGLTPPPTSSTDGLLGLLDPKDYVPSRETVEENGKNLISKLQFVLKWLEVLEWQGYGEIA